MNQDTVISRELYARKSAAKNNLLASEWAKYALWKLAVENEGNASETQAIEVVRRMVDQFERRAEADLSARNREVDDLRRQQIAIRNTNIVRREERRAA